LEVGFRAKGEEEIELKDEHSNKFQKSKGAEDVHKTKYHVDDQGWVQFPDGSKYKGALENGNPVGQGIMLYGDGSNYEGNWVGGNAEGFGILTF